MSDFIPLVDLKKNFLSIEDEIRASMERVLENTSFAMGPVMKEFEQAFADYCGVKYCLGVSSGLEALSIAMRCAGIGEGDEVILPANTFIATALGVSTLGATPVLVDPDPTTDLVTAEGMRAAITSKTKALLPVHLYGRLADMKPIQALAEEHGLMLFEDAAQSHGAKAEDGLKAGSFGLAGCFSFYPGKNLGAFGDGGAITTNDEALAKKIALYRNYGSDRKYYHDELGSNNRLDTLQAAVLLAKLPHLEAWTKARVALAANYDLLLQGVDVERPALVQDGSHVYHLYPIRVAKGVDRDAVLKALNEGGVGASIHYPVPVHLQGAYKDLPYEKGDFPISEDHAQRMISLPIFPELTREQQEKVVAVLKSVLQG
jgi:dTDP-4-amino-4,6-dideoxygalactose transaminase